MRRGFLLVTIALLSGAHAGLAQVSTMGTTAMGLPSTPGVIQSSPLNGPSPFSALTQPGAPDTTLAPLPLATDPSAPGTVVTCATPSGQITPGTPAAPVITVASAPSISAAPTTFAAPAAVASRSATNTPAPALALSAQPATSFMTDFPGTTLPAPQPPALPPLPSPSTVAVPVPAPSAVASTAPTFVPGTTAIASARTPTMSANAMTPGAVLGAIPTPFVTSTTGSISPTAPLGVSSTTVCSSVPGGPPTNGAALPLSTPDIPASPPPGTIQQDVSQLGGTSIDPATGLIPTPNTSACAEGTTIYMAAPGMMPAANATGAAATPGVSSPSGC